MGERIVLASASPRRRELLARAGLAFQVDAPDVDESFDPALDPLAAARLLAERKARVVAQRHRGSGVIVIAADTIVALERTGGYSYLGKPGDRAEARAMLAALSGARHQVVTGVCALDADSGVVALDAERTWVTMRRIEDREIEAYVASLEWLGKAGGYAIQESADLFVTALEGGGFDNVVGLPVPLTLELLERVRLARRARSG